ncbi:probable serine/threonine-protein kinase DDB_G0282963 [Hyla sarda]|uniref:probable serine/threonine-protein kinase DDB_G0282963 n=1 Tax=Hyla sarda TaxID=327740 RepID=UPI0024C28BEF|nr:probable serine/threonine-protein kinase DDB_G0282963 [Hyla sarda]
MGRSLLLCCLMALVIPAISLKCHTCVGSAYECNPTEVTCPGNNDKCSTSSLYIDSFPCKVHKAFKGCINSTIPSKKVSISPSDLITLSLQQDVCESDLCNTQEASDPDTNLNELYCHSCISPGASCTSATMKQLRCMGEQNLCTDIRVIGSFGDIADVNIKGCGQIPSCTQDLVFSSQTSSVSAKCCNGNYCNSDTDFAFEDKSPNGIQCHSCNTLDGASCSPKEVVKAQCYGALTSCLEIAGISMKDDRPIPTIIKGCATPSMCDSSLLPLLQKLGTATVKCCNGSLCNNQFSESSLKASGYFPTGKASPGTGIKTKHFLSPVKTGHHANNKYGTDSMPPSFTGSTSNCDDVNIFSAVNSPNMYPGNGNGEGVKGGSWNSNSNSGYPNPSFNSYNEFSNSGPIHDPSITTTQVNQGSSYNDLSIENPNSVYGSDIFSAGGLSTDNDGIFAESYTLSSPINHLSGEDNHNVLAPGGSALGGEGVSETPNYHSNDNSIPDVPPTFPDLNSYVDSSIVSNSYNDNNINYPNNNDFTSYDSAGFTEVAYDWNEDQSSSPTVAPDDIVSNSYDSVGNSVSDHSDYHPDAITNNNETSGHSSDTVNIGNNVHRQENNGSIQNFTSTTPKTHNYNINQQVSGYGTNIYNMGIAPNSSFGNYISSSGNNTVGSGNTSSAGPTGIFTESESHNVSSPMNYSSGENNLNTVLSGGSAVDREGVSETPNYNRDDNSNDTMNISSNLHTQGNNGSIQHLTPTTSIKTHNSSINQHISGYGTNIHNTGTASNNASGNNITSSGYNSSAGTSGIFTESESHNVSSPMNYSSGENNLGVVAPGGSALAGENVSGTPNCSESSIPDVPPTFVDFTTYVDNNMNPNNNDFSSYESTGFTDVAYIDMVTDDGQSSSATVSPNNSAYNPNTILLANNNKTGGYSPDIVNNGSNVQENNANVQNSTPTTPKIYNSDIKQQISGYGTNIHNTGNAYTNCSGKNIFSSENNTAGSGNTSSAGPESESHNVSSPINYSSGENNLNTVLSGGSPVGREGVSETPNYNSDDTSIPDVPPTFPDFPSYVDNNMVTNSNYDNNMNYPNNNDINSYDSAGFTEVVYDWNDGQSNYSTVLPNSTVSHSYNSVGNDDFNSYDSVGFTEVVYDWDEDQSNSPTVVPDSTVSNSYDSVGIDDFNNYDSAGFTEVVYDWDEDQSNSPTVVPDSTVSNSYDSVGIDDYNNYDSAGFTEVVYDWDEDQSSSPTVAPDGIVPNSYDSTGNSGSDNSAYNPNTILLSNNNETSGHSSDTLNIGSNVHTQGDNGSIQHLTPTTSIKTHNSGIKQHFSGHGTNIYNTGFANNNGSGNYISSSGNNIAGSGNTSSAGTSGSSTHGGYANMPGGNGSSTTYTSSENGTGMTNRGDNSSNSSNYNVAVPVGYGNIPVGNHSSPTYGSSGNGTRMNGNDSNHIMAIPGHDTNTYNTGVVNNNGSGNYISSSGINTSGSGNTSSTGTYGSSTHGGYANIPGGNESSTTYTSSENGPGMTNGGHNSSNSTNNNIAVPVGYGNIHVGNHSSPSYGSSGNGTGITNEWINRNDSSHNMAIPGGYNNIPGSNHSSTSYTGNGAGLSNQWSNSNNSSDHNVAVPVGYNNSPLSNHSSSSYGSSGNGTGVTNEWINSNVSSHNMAIPGGYNNIPGSNHSSTSYTGNGTGMPNQWSNTNHFNPNMSVPGAYANIPGSNDSELIKQWVNNNSSYHNMASPGGHYGSLDNNGSDYVSNSNYSSPFMMPNNGSNYGNSNGLSGSWNSIESYLNHVLSEENNNGSYSNPRLNGLFPGDYSNSNETTWGNGFYDPNSNPNNNGSSSNYNNIQNFLSTMNGYIHGNGTKNATEWFQNNSFLSNLFPPGMNHNGSRPSGFNINSMYNGSLSDYFKSLGASWNNSINNITSVFSGGKNGLFNISNFGSGWGNIMYNPNLMNPHNSGGSSYSNNQNPNQNSNGNYGVPGSNGQPNSNSNGMSSGGYNDGSINGNGHNSYAVPSGGGSNGGSTDGNGNSYNTNLMGNGLNGSMLGSGTNLHDIVFNSYSPNETIPGRSTNDSASGGGGGDTSNSSASSLWTTSGSLFIFSAIALLVLN